MTGSPLAYEAIAASVVAEGARVSGGANEKLSKRVPVDPFTHYPKHPTADDVYFIGGAWAPAAITARDKRFTGAELAAEYHSAWSELLDVPTAERYPYERHRIDTLHRFATLPHHDEEQP